jgi:hypothetical protein
MSISQPGSRGFPCRVIMKETRNKRSDFCQFLSSCVSVLYNVRKNRQRHVLSHAKKPVSCLQLSTDARYLATGESGHNPAVRIYDLAADNRHGVQVAELTGHHHGIACVVS